MRRLTLTHTQRWHVHRHSASSGHAASSSSRSRMTNTYSSPAATSSATLSAPASSPAPWAGDGAAWHDTPSGWPRPRDRACTPGRSSAPMNPRPAPSAAPGGRPTAHEPRSPHAWQGPPGRRGLPFRREPGRVRLRGPARADILGQSRTKPNIDGRKIAESARRTGWNSSFSSPGHRTSSTGPAGSRHPAPSCPPGMHRRDSAGRSGGHSRGSPENPDGFQGINASRPRVGAQRPREALGVTPRNGQNCTLSRGATSEVKSWDRVAPRRPRSLWRITEICRHA